MARAMIYTPLVSSTGALLGMIYTYFALPHRPSERELHFLTFLARQAADYLEHTRARETKKILLRELQHRSNNLLSVIQSIVHGSLSKSHSLDQAKTALEARLQALARANRQLTGSNWNGMDLSSIVRFELEPFIERIKIEGTKVILDPRNAQDLSLAVHELATNAAKYGALSANSGRVAISWSVRPNGKQDVLRINWQESDGPPVVPPKNNGLGTSLLKAICPDVHLRFAGAGLTCEIEVLLDRTERGAAKPDMRHTSSSDATDSARTFSV